jgi:hypothetical protein
MNQIPLHHRWTSGEGNRAHALSAPLGPLSRQRWLLILRKVSKRKGVDALSGTHMGLGRARHTDWKRNSSIAAEVNERTILGSFPFNWPHTRLGVEEG